MTGRCEVFDGGKDEIELFPACFGLPVIHAVTIPAKLDGFITFEASTGKLKCTGDSEGIYNADPDGATSPFPILIKNSFGTDAPTNPTKPDIQVIGIEVCPGSVTACARCESGACVVCEDVSWTLAASGCTDPNAAPPDDSTPDSETPETPKDEKFTEPDPANEAVGAATMGAVFA